MVERENCGCGVAERSGQINSLGRNLLDTAQTILSQKPMPRQNTMISAFTARNAIRWVCMHLSAIWIIITNEKLFSTPLNFHEHTLPLKKSLLWKLQSLNQCVWISEVGRYHFGYGELYSPFVWIFPILGDILVTGDCHFYESASPFYASLPFTPQCRYTCSGEGKGENHLKFIWPQLLSQGEL